MMTNLAEGLPAEQLRVRELIQIYENLPNNCGMPAAYMMRTSLAAAERAAASGDVVAMLRAYQDLKGYKE